MNSKAVRAASVKHKINTNSQLAGHLKVFVGYVCSSGVLKDPTTY